MHQLKMASHSKPARIASAVSIETEEAARQKALHHGMTLSQYVDSLIVSDLNSQADKHDLSLLALTNHLHHDMAKALGDGVLSPVEREDITDHVARLLYEIRTA